MDSANGFTIERESYGRALSDTIWFTGSAAQAEKALNIKIVKTTSDNLFFNTSDPMVPAPIAAAARQIDGLDNTTPLPGGGPKHLSPSLDISPNISSLVPSVMYSTYMNYL
jgi:hypothetical protein